MTDIELLGEFRLELAELEPDRRARMRARILAAMDESQADSVGGDPSGRDGDVGNGKPEVTVIDLRPVATPPRGVLVSGSRRVAIVGALAAVLAIVFGAVTVIGRNPGGEVVTHLGVPSPATLRELADAARRQPDRPLASGQYLYTRERYAVTTDLSVGTAREDVISVFDQETWIDRDGLGRLVNHEQVTMSRTGETLRVEPIASDQSETTPSLFGGGYTYDQLRALPADPAVLASLLLEGNTNGDPPADYLLSVATQLLQPAVLPPTVRAALFEVLAMYGVRVVPEATTWNGQPGVGLVGRSQDGDILRVIVDAQTGTLRGWFTYKADGQPPSSANIDEWREYVDQAVVDSIDVNR
jgi:hypothetical protein